MKKSLLLTAVLIVALVLTSCATIDKTSEDVGVLQEVITYKGQTEEELYTKARSWFVEAFNSSESVIEQQDKESGIIKGKYTDNVARNAFCDVVYESVITVEVKAERVRFSISAPLNAYTVTSRDKFSTDKFTASEVDKMNISRQVLLENFKEYMSTEHEEW